MNKPLAKLQKDLSRALRENIEPVGIRGSPDSARERLEVYRRAYKLRLGGALKDDFAFVHEALGDDFDQYVDDFLSAFPSTYASLNELGQKFPYFLSRHPDLSARVEIVELARFEWAQVVCAQGQEPSQATQAALKQGVLWAAPTDQARLKLASTSRCFKSSVSLRHFLTADSGTHENSQGPEYYWIFKSPTEIDWELLSEQEWNVMSAIQDGSNLDTLARVATQARCSVQMLQNLFAKLSSANALELEIKTK